MSSFALLLALLIAGQAAVLPQTPSSLSGTWEGIQTLDQVGDCMLAGTNQRRLQIAVLVETDGSLRVEQAGSSRDFDWTGSIGDGKVVFEVPSQARCNSETGLRSARYSGAFPTLKDGKRRLTLRGTEEPCPEHGCRFARTMYLTWKGPLPAAER
jgi:hypothetical protein